MLSYILVIAMFGFGGSASVATSTAEFLDRDRCERAAKVLMAEDKRIKAYCFQK